jgi:hypothetical protein
MKHAVLLLACLLAVPVPALGQTKSAQKPGSAKATVAYFPDRFDWQIRTPEQAGFDTAKLDAAIAFAIASENPATRDLAVDLATTFGREPFDTPIGPIKPRGGLNGIIGQVLAALK